MKIVQQINNIEVFSKFLEKYKVFRELPEQYKTDKFISLYSKMYEYMLSIPKEKIVLSDIVKRNEYIQYLFKYALCFIEAKDFYNWKERIYSLLTEKISNSSKRKFELLYGSKWEEFYSKCKEKKKSTCMKNYGVENPSQSKQIKEKKKSTCMKNYGVENPSQSKQIKEKKKSTCLEIYSKENVFQVEKIKEKCKAKHIENLGVDNPMKSKKIQDKFKSTCMKNLGVEHPLQSKEVQEQIKATNLERYSKESYSQTEEFKEKTSNTWKNKTEEEIESIVNKRKSTCMKNLGVEHPLQSKEVQEKRKTTCVERYGILYTCLLSNEFHSKFGDEICTIIDNALGNPEDSKYAIKNGEFSLKRINNNYYFYDYCIPSKKLIVEADGCYYHGLIEGQKDVKGTPVEEIWAKDKEKEELAIQNGYKVFHIRDDEYFSNPELTISNLLKKINGITEIN